MPKLCASPRLATLTYFFRFTRGILSRSVVNDSTSTAQIRIDPEGEQIGVHMVLQQFHGPWQCALLRLFWWGPTRWWDQSVRVKSLKPVALSPTRTNLSLVEECWLMGSRQPFLSWGPSQKKVEKCALPRFCEIAVLCLSRFTCTFWLCIYFSHVRYSLTYIYTHPKNVLPTTAT